MQTLLGRILSRPVVRTLVPVPALALAATLAGCAHGSSIDRTAAAADLTVPQAQHIVEQWNDRHELPPSNSPLNSPKSLDDVLEALRLDQMDLFANSARFAAGEGTMKGKALAGQILIAWGDGQYLLADLLGRASADLRDQQARLQKREELQKITDDEHSHLRKVQAALHDVEGVEAALRKVGGRHVADGGGYAQQVIGTNPSDYEGYRVAADYYHEVEDWGRFDEMVKKIEAMKPDSVGLVFLRAEAARDRDRDFGKAEKLFKEALAKDPRFVRAQVALLVLQPDINAAYVEMNKLASMNPNHQVVTWMGPTLKKTYDEWVSLNRRRALNQANRALPGAE